MTTSCSAKKTPAVIYSTDIGYESAVEGLKIFLPTEQGYVNHNFIHTVNTVKNADIWRLSVANVADDSLNITNQITKEGAEWEMALRLKGRPDFIGGFAHGDEKFTDLSVTVDGKETDIKTLTEARMFNELKMVVRSVGFDPSAQSEKVLLHTKEFTVTKDGVTVYQTVEWLKDCELDPRFKCFMAMMPPLKHALENDAEIITDSYFTDLDGTPRDIRSLPVVLGVIKSVTVSGKDSGLTFNMAVSDYSPLYDNAYLASLSDNGSKNNYNKMYIAFAGGMNGEVYETVAKGDIWTSKTHYTIENK